MINKVKHTIGPFYQSDSEILILGSFPSVKSRDENFYYMHPQNRFWKVLSKVFNDDIENSVEGKRKFLIKHKIALWDVIESCEITGSSDMSIKNIKVNKIAELIKNSKVKYIFTTGKKAYNLYNKYCLKDTNIHAIPLYSTSPANAKYSLVELVENYKVINIKK